ncbi:MAG TPA: VTT domain-containing protein [Opitutaceae bacterium]|nr:VTT domain-containing protein [Opitutaceae bacterium]
MSTHPRIRWGWIFFAGLLIAVAVIVGRSEAWDWHAFLRRLENMDRLPLLALAAILPLFGFSIAVVYVVIGAVFGGWPGMAVVTGLTAIHLCGSHWIARSFLRGPLQRFLKRRKKQLPELPKGEEWAVALMTALVPGLPYVVRNYLLALSPVPFRIYFPICLPVYVFRSGIVIFFGDFTSDLSVQRVVILGAILVVKVAVCALLLHRLRIRYKLSHGSQGAG